MTTTGLALTLAAAVLLGYALCLGRLLRGTRPAAWAWIGTATVVAAGLRLVHTGDYPPYLSEDETKSLAQAMVLLKIGVPLQIFEMGEIILPITSSVLFKATLVPLVGPTRWAMRSYSLLCSLLSVPAAFAVGRAFGFRVAPSLALAGFLATLNWAIFYGRVGLGASMVFHQLLLLAALARLARGRGGWPEAAIGGFALTLLLYDYHPGRVLIGLPLLGALLATGRRRLMCLAMPLLAFAAFWPHAVATNYAPFAYYREHAGLGMGEGVLGDFGAFRIVLDNHLWSYVTPANSTAPVLSIRSGSWHPALLVLLAVVGSLRTPRLALILWCGFLATLMPSLLSGSEIPSSRRLLATYPFLAIAAAAALDWIRPRRLRNPAVALTVVIAAVQSVAMFFSAETWPEEERNDPETQISSVIESLPAAPAVPVILTSDFWQHLRPQIEAGRTFESHDPAGVVPAGRRCDPRLWPLLEILAPVPRIPRRAGHPRLRPRLSTRSDARRLELAARPRLDVLGHLRRHGARSARADPVSRILRLRRSLLRRRDRAPLASPMDRGCHPAAAPELGRAGDSRRGRQSPARVCRRSG